MRTPRVFILLTLVLASFTLLILSLRSSSKPTEHTENQAKSDSSGVLNTFSFNTPLSLFPPNAIISLTDDNTTSFLARPAAFGPPLPSTGLSGQLWVGSGFGDDSLRHGIISTGGEGELGCSDVMPDANNIVARPLDNLLTSTTPNNRHRRDTARNDIPDDGTDDNRYNAVSDAMVVDRRMVSGWPLKSSTNSGASHADIQSIQESAEIAGKVVMLSRGGCGFLEKVEWAQRRGGIAVIVADDTRGGPLIQMYARGDTSNVTIPSVFTSHTTAHLLSSLIPPGTYIEDATNEDGDSVVKVKHSKKSKRKGKKGSKQHKSRKGSTGAVPKGYTVSSRKSGEPAVAQPRHDSWLGRLIWASKPSQPAKKDILDWVVVDEWDDKVPVTSTKAGNKGKVASKAAPKDGFDTGVHDWRDPDFIKNAGSDNSKPREEAQRSSGKVQNKSPIERLYTPSVKAEEKKSNSDLKDGSTTIGSGEYGTGTLLPDTNTESHGADKPGLFSKLFGDDDENDIKEPGMDSEYGDDGPDYDNVHEGLWVTLTQTSGATPFFDTLLVLVVSPLVTLTIVYTLLLVRSRIRQRRWRAPKSVVERLPVRTYRTIPTTSSDQSRQPSPSSSSPTTPLLQQSPTRPRPRSRTTSGLPEPTIVSRTNSGDPGTPRPRRANEHEKKGDWKKYMGRQVECVVCLEEYVDGVSRVMSLPCGHEFHVDCM